MVTYMLLLKWTEQGIKNVKDTVKRGDDLRKLSERLGGRVTSLYWTQGPYDVVALLEAPDEATANAISIALGMGGNVRTDTLRAFSADEMQSIISKLP